MLFFENNPLKFHAEHVEERNGLILIMPLVENIELMNSFLDAGSEVI